MKLKRRDFLKSIVPAIWGGKKTVEDLLRGPGEEPEPEEVVQVDTPTGVTATHYPGYRLSMEAYVNGREPRNIRDIFLSQREGRK